MDEVLTRKSYIELFRKNGFNCFPIPQYPKAYKEQKGADSRYKGSKTVVNQSIDDNDNYGVLPINGNGNAVIDFDDKERYRKFAGYMIEKGYMVIESPHGWHIPVIGISGLIQKVMLYDYNVQDKQIIEIQGYDHYVVGVGSKIYDKETDEPVFYQNRGSDKIWDAGKKDFHQFVEELCKQCKVEGKRRDSRSSCKNMRERFLKGLPPTKGTSNDYFFQSAMQCNTDGLTRDDALEKIKKVYDTWSETKDFSHRPFSNIEAKVNDVYNNDKKLTTGRPKGTSIDRTEIAQNMIEDRPLYSDPETHEIFQDTNGFLEKINHTLKKELVKTYPNMEEADYKSILFKLESLSEDIPKLRKDFFVFKNGKYDKQTHVPIETDEVADVGFKDYNYLPPTKENEPVRWLGIVFDNVPQEEHPRIKAGLKAVFESYLDPRMSIIHGLSGVGKSTGMNVLVRALGEYAQGFELQEFLGDHFIRAKIKNKLLVVFQDLPDNWKDFNKIKNITGEQTLTERGFHQDAEKINNRIKIWATCNYLTKIPEKEKNPMYKRRLSLIHNIRKESYEEDSRLEETIAEEEGEKIISWILNIPEDDCRYEKSETVKAEWEKLASPETGFLERYYEMKSDAGDVSVGSIVKQFKIKHPEVPMNITTMKAELMEQGYDVRYFIVKDIVEKVIKEEKRENGDITVH